jgi:hypothetical protein
MGRQGRAGVALGAAERLLPAGPGDGLWIIGRASDGSPTVRLVDALGQERVPPVTVPADRRILWGGERLLVSGPRRMLEWWDPRSSALQRVASAARPVAVNPDGSIAIVSAECQACTIHVRSAGSTNWTLSASSPDVKVVSAGAFSTTGSHLALPVTLNAGGHAVVAYDLASESSRTLFMAERPFAMAWVPGSPTLIVLHGDGRMVTRWDLRRGVTEELRISGS